MRFLRYIIFFLFTIISYLLPFTSLKSQNISISGKVIDKKSREPLAFAIIKSSNDKYFTTDVDGKFKISLLHSDSYIDISYTAYKHLRLFNSKFITHQTDLLIELERDEIMLPEVEIVPGVNPALRIINNAIKNSDTNNPEKLNSFSYSSYNKMIFTYDTDTLKKKIRHKKDSIAKETARILDKMYLMLMESVALHKYVYPDRHSDKVIASKISGFKDPLLILLASQFQSFSFYNNYVSIAEKLYDNPISESSKNKYIFILKDTLFIDRQITDVQSAKHEAPLKDTVYIIQFLPKNNTNFDGMKGLLYINTNKFAIQNVIAEPATTSGSMNVKIQQLYEFISVSDTTQEVLNTKHNSYGQWFPVQLITDIRFNNVSVAKDKLIAQGKTYIKNISINPIISKKEFGNSGFEVLDNPAAAKDSFWLQYRNDSLTKKERNTYRIIDSIGKSNNFDGLTKALSNLVTGRISFKFIDFKIDQLIQYHNYQGFTYGMGIETNNKLNKYIHFGGYYNYSSRIEKSLWGANINILTHLKSDLSFNFSYDECFEETGGVRFFDNNGALLNKDFFWNVLVNMQDYVIRKAAAINLRPFNFTLFNIALNYSKKQFRNDYRFRNIHDESDLLQNYYNYSEITAGIRYNYNEQIIKTPLYNMTQASDYPILWLQFTKSFKSEFFASSFAYNKIDIRLNKSFKIKNLGISTFNLSAGLVDKSIPYSNLYNGRGGYQKFTIQVMDCFSTMRYNEFFSDKFINLFYNHNFKNLLFKTRKFKPEFVFTTNISFGSINGIDNHNISFKTLNHGYYESGVLMNHIINFKLYNLGLGLYYRYGPYRFKNDKENLAAKFTINFPL